MKDKKYIALLRGINVGGNTKISMKKLKQLFEKIGFKNVITYINSGNVIFSTSDTNEEEIKIICENAIKNKFNFDIPVGIISVTNLSKTLNNAPIWWDRDKECKHNAIFVISPATAKELIKQIGMSEYEQISYYEQIIFWTAPYKTFSKTNWSKIAKSPLYKCITIRNSNTIKKLAKYV